MGLGDEIMVTGEVMRLQASDPRPVLVTDRKGKARWCWVWAGSRRILHPNHVKGVDHQVLRNGPGYRPYIDYGRTVEFKRWFYTEWQVTAGELFVPERAMRWAAAFGGCVVVEPSVKAAASPNKQWGRWQALLDARPGLHWVQPVHAQTTERLHGAAQVPTPDFWQAVALLSVARAAVLPEGGLHHAAAAVGCRAVVLFGHLLRPWNTGYAEHVNLAPDDSGCGWRVPCADCAAYWQELSPEHVATALDAVMG